MNNKNFNNLVDFIESGLEDDMITLNIEVARNLVGDEETINALTRLLISYDKMLKLVENSLDIAEQEIERKNQLIDKATKILND